MAEDTLTIAEQIAQAEKAVAALTEVWNLAQFNRDPIATKAAEEELIIAQTELNVLLMRRKV